MVVLRTYNAMTRLTSSNTTRTTPLGLARHLHLSARMKTVTQLSDPQILTQPTAYMPAQYFDLTPGRQVPTGIRRLMAAILEDAINVYRTHANAATNDRRRLHAQARRWLASDDTTWVFSFRRITEALGIEPSGLRRKLRVRPAFMPSRPPTPLIRSAR